MRYHTKAEIERRGWEAVIDRVVTEASEEGRKLHISFDIDVIDAAFTVATGTPVPGGLDMRESIAIDDYYGDKQKYLDATEAEDVKEEEKKKKAKEEAKEKDAIRERFNI